MSFAQDRRGKEGHAALQGTACTAVCLCLMARLTSTARALVDYRELCGGAGGQPSWGPSRGPSRGPGHFELPGVPGMALGTLGDHLCAGTPEKSRSSYAHAYSAAATEGGV